MVFQRALKTAGITAHTAPASIEVTAMTISMSQFGRRSPMNIIHAAEARPPMRAWPSAPMFQNRILNAGVTASEMQRSIAMPWSSDQRRRSVPKAPSNIVVKTFTGSLPVRKTVTAAESIIPRRIEMIRTSQAFHHSIFLRLTIWKPIRPCPLPRCQRSWSLRDRPLPSLFFSHPQFP